MSFSNVRSYFRTRMESLGHKEWTDALNFENIPESIQDRIFHIETPTASGNSQNQTRLDANFDANIRLFTKAFRNTSNGIDRAIEFAESAICDIINPANANGTDIKDVQFSGMTIGERSASNDNTIIAEMNFTARLFLDTES